MLCTWKIFCLGLDIWVTKVVQTCIGYADGGDAPLVPVIDRAGRQMLPHFIAEHIAAILPKRPGFKPHFDLLCLVPPKQRYHSRGGGDRAALTVLGGGKAVLSRLSRNALKLFIDPDGSPLQAYAIPGKSADFSSTHPGKKHSQIYGLVAVALDSRDKSPHSFIVQRLDFLSLHPWQFTSVGGIEAEIAQFYGLLEGLVEYTVYILHRFGRQTRACLKNKY